MQEKFLSKKWKCVSYRDHLEKQVESWLSWLSRIWYFSRYQIVVGCEHFDVQRFHCAKRGSRLHDMRVAPLSRKRRVNVGFPVAVAEPPHGFLQRGQRPQYRSGCTAVHPCGRYACALKTRPLLYAACPTLRPTRFSRGATRIPCVLPLWSALGASSAPSCRAAAWGSLRGDGTLCCKQKKTIVLI